MRAFAYLLTIYLVWGSTYLAMRVGVMNGSGFSPFSFGAVRLLIAGPIILLISYLMKKRIRITASEFKSLALSGILLWLTGHGLILWGEQYIESGYTALILAASPVFVLIMESFLDKKIPNVYLSLFILIGFIGTGILVMPKLKGGLNADFFAVSVIVIGMISWAAGALYQQRRKVRLPSLAMSGYQQLFGGIGFLIVSIILQEPLPHPATSAWFALVYLIIFGSIIAFTVYLKALATIPISVVMTYSYVNPFIAVILGYFILNEDISSSTLLGGMIIVISVFGIIVKKGRRLKA
ncbi:MAG: EamA family transporter [Proteobacteria bacterium]|nr:EamA family transporter [Pseudomonadota bacterium]